MSVATLAVHAALVTGNDKVVLGEDLPLPHDYPMKILDGHLYAAGDAPRATCRFAHVMQARVGLSNDAKTRQRKAFQINRRHSPDRNSFDGQ